MGFYLAAFLPIQAQTFQIVFQGSLNHSASPANGSYDFEFVLYDAPAGGNQVGSVQTRNGVTVSNGTFSTQLDFGLTAFPGAPRYIEIRVRPTGQPGITVLDPRQQVARTPYAIRSFMADNAAGLNGLPGNQFVITTDPRMSDARQPVAGSGDYIQNRLTPQAATNFNIGGSGTVGGTLAGNIVNATVQYNINGNRVLSSPVGSNTFVGISAGESNDIGILNSFFGTQAGQNNTSGRDNSFFGMWAGRQNTSGSNNSFFGVFAGSINTTGRDNTFVGHAAGLDNSTADGNSFFGSNSGLRNTIGSSNSFFGNQSGQANISGGGNSFFGANAGSNNTTGMTNSFFGANSGLANTTGQNNAFFGVNAGAANTSSLGNSFFGANAGAANTGQFNSFFGASAGLVNTTGVNNSFFGTVAGVANTIGFANSFFGHWAGHDNTTGDNNTFVGRSAGELSTTGNGNTFVGQNAGIANMSGSNNTIVGAGANLTDSDLTFATAIGAGSEALTSNTITLGRSNGADQVVVPGQFVVWEYATTATNAICATVTGRFGLCSSSIRFKTEIEDYTGGLDVVRQLRPISFRWKEDGFADVGFAAEEINLIEPRLVVLNKSREIQGVRYGQITTVLVNAVKEQQTEIERQAETIKRMEQQIDALRKLVCAENPTSEICREER